MTILRRSWALLALAGVALAGCTDGYGYSGVSVGYSSPGYYGSAYDYDGFAGPGYAAFDDGYFGWYGGYYYPGSGYYVYDQARRPYRWNSRQRAYWEGRRFDGRGGPRENWQGFQHRPSGPAGWQDYRNTGRDRGEWRGRRFDRPGAVANGAVPPDARGFGRGFGRPPSADGRAFRAGRPDGVVGDAGVGQPDRRALGRGFDRPASADRQIFSRPRAGDGGGFRGDGGRRGGWQRRR